MTNTERRIAVLKKMNDKVLATGDEDIFARWFEYGIPDEPTEEDYEYCATHDNDYYDTVALFCELQEEYPEEFF